MGVNSQEGETGKVDFGRGWKWREIGSFPPFLKNASQKSLRGHKRLFLKWREIGSFPPLWTILIVNCSVLVHFVQSVQSVHSFCSLFQVSLFAVWRERGLRRSRLWEGVIRRGDSLKSALLGSPLWGRRRGVLCEVSQSHIPPISSHFPSP